jgi:hypothetical protein
MNPIPASQMYLNDNPDDLDIQFAQYDLEEAMDPVNNQRLPGQVRGELSIGVHAKKVGILSLEDHDGPDPEQRFSVLIMGIRHDDSWLCRRYYHETRPSMILLNTLNEHGTVEDTTVVYLSSLGPIATIDMSIGGSQPGSV